MSMFKTYIWCLRTRMNDTWMWTRVIYWKAIWIQNTMLDTVLDFYWNWYHDIM